MRHSGATHILLLEMVKPIGNRWHGGERMWWKKLSPLKRHQRSQNSALTVSHWLFLGQSRARLEQQKVLWSTSLTWHLLRERYEYNVKSTSTLSVREEGIINSRKPALSKSMGTGCGAKWSDLNHGPAFGPKLGGGKQGWLDFRALPSRWVATVDTVACSSCWLDRYLD